MGRFFICRRGMTFKDMIAAMLIVSLLSGTFLLAAQAANERSNRIMCAGNLRALGMALMFYANENRGAYPRTVARMDAKPTSFTSWKPANPNPFAAGGPGPNDVTAALYLLVRVTEVDPATFICPSSTANPIHLRSRSNPATNPTSIESMNRESFFRQFPDREAIMASARVPKPLGQPVANAARDLANFPSLDVLSYSLSNPYGDRAAYTAGFRWSQGRGAEIALIADINPGTDEVIKATQQGFPAADAAPATLTPAQRAANSPNHAGQGQNILYGDGHIDFQQTPFAGAIREGQARDNIYTRNLPSPRPAGEDPIQGSPMDGSDSVLLPTAKKAI